MMLTNIDVFLKDYAIIMGHVATCEEMRERYRVDEVKMILFSNIVYFFILFPENFDRFCHIRKSDPVHDMGRILIPSFLLCSPLRSFVDFL
jgi:hypothetical protein